MIIEFSKLISAISRATDFVEAEIMNIPPYHEKRIAVLANRMAAYMGMDAETVYALTLAGALHDCALSEYLDDEFSETGDNQNELDMAAHCIAGERMLAKFPFYQRVKGAVLHHHDRADGKGALRKKAEETPVYGQLLHIADLADSKFFLNTMDQEKYDRLMTWIRYQCGTAFSEECCRVFSEAIDYNLLCSITGDHCIGVLEELVPCVTLDVPVEILREIATFFAHITDYKSHFTWNHSMGIAEKAERFGEYHGYSREMCDKLFIAGALHDIGKLLIRNDILEKPGKLTPEEYQEITNHALGTWEMLHDIGGMEDIARWASLHHEKLNGSGYPFGFRAEDLGKQERLMACLDIYQALVEERPYKAGMSHMEAMAILRKMGAAGQLDQGLIEDIDACHAIHSACAVGERQPESRKKSYSREVWICPVCGFVYEGKLPDDFICPRCEQPGTIFERYE